MNDNGPVAPLDLDDNGRYITPLIVPDAPITRRKTKHILVVDPALNTEVYGDFGNLMDTLVERSITSAYLATPNASYRLTWQIVDNPREVTNG